VEERIVQLITSYTAMADLTLPRQAIQARQDSGEQLLKLFANPFQAQVSYQDILMLDSSLD